MLRPSQIEKRAKWIKKKVEDIIPGDVIKDYGLVLEINLTSDPDGFWSGQPNITCFDLNDSYYGPGCRELTETEFEVLDDRRDLVDAHNIVDSDLAKHIADILEYRRKFLELHRDFFNAYNKAHPRKKKRYAKKDESDV